MEVSKYAWDAGRGERPTHPLKDKDQHVGDDLPSDALLNLRIPMFGSLAELAPVDRVDLPERPKVAEDAHDEDGEVDNADGYAHRLVHRHREAPNGDSAGLEASMTLRQGSL